MQIKPIMKTFTQNKIFKGIKNLSIANKVLKNKNQVEALPLVATPLIAYMAIDYNKMKSNVTYRNNVEDIKQEFAERHLPFDDSYINQFSGEASSKGQSILNNYDSIEALFKNAKLEFKQEYINPFTGDFSFSGRSIYNNFQKTCKIFKEQGMPLKDHFYNHSTGNISSIGQKALANPSIAFNGAPDDIHNQPYVNDPNAEIGGDMPKIYEPEDYELMQQDPELIADIRELNAMDAINLPSDLQEIYDAPSFDDVADLIKEILGDEYADLVNIDWDFGLF